MKKAILGLVCAIVVIVAGVFIYNKFFAVKATIPIYSCTYIGYDGKEYTSTVFEKVENGTCKVKKEYKCKYEKCELVNVNPHGYAVIYDGDGSKGGKLIIDKNTKKLLGPLSEIKMVYPYYFLTKADGSNTYSVYESDNKNGVKLVIEDTFDDVYSVTSGDSTTYSYIGVVNGKHGIINQDSISNSKYIYDLVTPSNYHSLGFSCLKVSDGGKQNILYNGIDGYTEAFSDWYDTIDTFSFNDIVYVAYASEGKIYVGTFDYKKDANGTSAIEREFKLVSTLDINYKENVTFYQNSDNTKIGITIDDIGYSYDIATKQLTKN